MNHIVKHSSKEVVVPKNIAEVIEMKMLLAKGEEIDFNLKHHFSTNMYIREVTMPTDTIVLGHEHTTTHLNILSKGSIIVVDLTSGNKLEIEAPYTFESLAGVRKIFFVIEEATFSTVHSTDETDIDKLEDTLIIQSDVHKAYGTKLIGG